MFACYISRTISSLVTLHISRSEVAKIMIYGTAFLNIRLETGGYFFRSSSCCCDKGSKETWKCRKTYHGMSVLVFVYDTTGFIFLQNSSKTYTFAGCVSQLRGEVPVLSSFQVHTGRMHDDATGRINFIVSRALVHSSSSSLTCNRGHKILICCIYVFKNL